MNPVRLAVAELRRLTSSRLARLALAALVLIPTLYGGLYLYANHDPYGAFPQVPAAVVPVGIAETWQQALPQARLSVIERCGHLPQLEHPQVTAIFASNDLPALGAMNAIADMGMNVPRDVSVTGITDIQWARVSRPANMLEFVKSKMWKPVYESYVK